MKKTIIIFSLLLCSNILVYSEQNIDTESTPRTYNFNPYFDLFVVKCKHDTTIDFKIWGPMWLNKNSGLGIGYSFIETFTIGDNGVGTVFPIKLIWAPRHRFDEKKGTYLSLHAYLQFSYWASGTGMYDPSASLFNIGIAYQLGRGGIYLDKKIRKYPAYVMFKVEYSHVARYKEVYNLPEVNEGELSAYVEVDLGVVGRIILGLGRLNL
jgi:hypothetical protein